MEGGGEGSLVDRYLCRAALKRKQIEPPSAALTYNVWIHEGEFKDDYRLKEYKDNEGACLNIMYELALDKAHKRIKELENRILMTDTQAMLVSKIEDLLKHNSAAAMEKICTENQFLREEAMKMGKDVIIKDKEIKKLKEEAQVVVPSIAAQFQGQYNDKAARMHLVINERYNEMIEYVSTNKPTNGNRDYKTYCEGLVDRFIEYCDMLRLLLHVP